MNLNIAYNFWLSTQEHPQNVALVSGKETYSYSELTASVQQLAQQLKPHLTHGRVGILGTRSA